MNLKKPVIVGSAIFLLLIVGLPLVMAASMDPFSSIFDLLKSMLNVVFKLFNLTELGLDQEVNQIAFMRLMIWVITFAIFNTVTKLLFSKSGGLSGSQGADKLPMIISLCLATITAVFTPKTILLAIGIQYSALISAILLLGVLGFLLYIAYGVIKPKSFMGHVLRFLIVFVCWMVLMNFTAVTDNNAFSPTISNTNISFNNSVLSYIWSVLSMIIGVLLVYEIFKMIGSVFKSSVGNLGGHMSNAAGWLNNTKAGGKDLKDSLGFGKGKSEQAEKNFRDEKSLITQTASNDNIISSMLDLEVRNGEKLSNNLKALLEQLTQFSEKIKPFIQNPEKYNKKSVLDSNEKFMKSVAKKLDECKRLDERRMGEGQRAYDQGSKEFKAVLLEGDMLKLNEAHDALNTELKNNPKLRENKVISDNADLFFNRYNLLVEDIGKIKKLDQEKIRYIYQGEKNLELERNKIDAIIKAIHGVDWKNHIATPDAIISISKQIQDVINTIQADEQQLQEAYTLNRDGRELIEITNQHLAQLHTANKNATNEIRKVAKAASGKDAKGMKLGQ